MEQSVFGQESYLMLLMPKQNLFNKGLCVKKLSTMFLIVWLTIIKILSSILWSILGLCFALDPSTVPPSLHLSNSSLTVTYQEESPPGPPPDNRVSRTLTSDPGVTPALPQVCADVVIVRGQYYWEVDVCNSSVYRIGKNS